MKKLVMMVVASFVLLLTACSTDTREKLYVYNVGEYIDREVLAMFEEEFNCKVVYELYDSNETMYQKIKAGGTNYDVAFPSDYMAEKMIKENLVLPLDYSKIPNFKYISDEYKHFHMMQKIYILFLTSGGQLEFYMIKQWLKNQLTHGQSYGMKTIKVISLCMIANVIH